MNAPSTNTHCFFGFHNLAVVSALVNGLMCAAQRQLDLPGVIPVMLLALTGKWLNTSLAAEWLKEWRPVVKLAASWLSVK